VHTDARLGRATQERLEGLRGTSVSKNWSKSWRMRLGKYVVSAISG